MRAEEIFLLSVSVIMYWSKTPSTTATATKASSKLAAAHMAKATRFYNQQKQATAAPGNFRVPLWLILFWEVIHQGTIVRAFQGAHLLE